MITTAVDKYIQSTDCDPNNPRDEDLQYRALLAKKLWKWKIDEYITKEKNEATQLTVYGLKRAFEQHSPQLIEMALKLLVEDGKIELSSGEKARNITYTVTKKGLEEMKQEEEAENIKRLRERALQDAEEKAAQEQQKQLQKQKTQARVTALGKKRTVDSSEPFSSFDKENHKANVNASDDSIQPKKVKYIVFDASPVRSQAAKSSTFLPSSSSFMQITNTIELNRPNNLPHITKTLQQEFEKDGECIQLLTVFNQLNTSADACISIDEFYSGLEHLSNDNKIMVDWDEGDKQMSMIYLM